MIKKVFCLLLFCVVALVAAAQEVEFTADRPGASTGPATVGQKVIQLEQGIQYDGVGDGYGQFTFGNTLLRYGLFDGVELRLGGDALIHHTFDKWQLAFAGLAVLRVEMLSPQFRFWQTLRYLVLRTVDSRPST